MSIWTLLQVAFNIFLCLAVWTLWTRFRRPPKDDPRLSRGLQLLQSKISVLEDLSDKTDMQVKQLSALLEKKCREVQKKIEDSEQQMNKIDQSVAKSLEVASIFEDRIPHQEIIERKRTRAYVKAAKLAHQGLSIDEIADQVDISRGELEMVVKVNRDRLMFSEEDLPAWAHENESEEREEQGESALDRVEFAMEGQEISEDEEKKTIEEDYSSAFRPAIEVPKSLEKLGAEFRKACEQVREEERQLQQLEVESGVDHLVQQLSSSAVNKFRQISQKTKDLSLKDVLLQKEERKPVAKTPEPAKTQKIIRANGSGEVAAEEVKKVRFPRLDGDVELR